MDLLPFQHVVFKKLIFPNKPNVEINGPRSSGKRFICCKCIMNFYQGCPIAIVTSHYYAWEKLMSELNVDDSKIFFYSDQSQMPPLMKFNLTIFDNCACPWDGKCDQQKWWLTTQIPTPMPPKKKHQIQRIVIDESTVNRNKFPQSALMDRIEFIPINKLDWSAACNSLLVVPAWGFTPPPTFKFSQLTEYTVLPGNYVVSSSKLKLLRLDLSWVENLYLLEINYSQVCEFLEPLLNTFSRKFRGIVLKYIIKD